MSTSLEQGRFNYQLEQRIIKLERRLKLTFSAFALVVLCGLGMGAYKGVNGNFHLITADSISTKAIYLEDDKANTVGKWEMMPDGSCQLVVSDVSLEDKPSRFARILVEKGFVQVSVQQGGEDTFSSILVNDKEAGCLVKEKDKAWKKLN